MIDPDIQARIDALVATGAYPSVDAVLCDALSALEAMTGTVHLFNDPELDAKIQQGIRSIEDGHYTSYSLAELPRLAEEIKAEGRARLKQRYVDCGAI